MGETGTPYAPIPEQWKKSVSAILRGPKNKIITTRQADVDWQTAFPNAWNNDRSEAMAEALEEAEVQGLHEPRMREPGETYAFWFFFENTKMYGKINLLKGGDKILIYSSHPPHRGEEL